MEDVDQKDSTARGPRKRSSLVRNHVQIPPTLLCIQLTGGWDAVQTASSQILFLLHNAVWFISSPETRDSPLSVSFSHSATDQTFVS